MKPEVEAAIESRRQWFWVWVLGICTGFVITFLLFQCSTDPLYLAITFLVLAAAVLFVQSLRLQKALLAWASFIAAFTAVALSVLVMFVNSILS